MKKALLLTITLLVSNFIFSQVTFVVGETDIPDSIPTLTFSGFADVYYTYNLNKPGMEGNWATTGNGRVFDGEHNQIAFNMLQTKFEYSSKRIGIVGDLVFGPGAEIANYGNTGTSQIIKQAYIEYKTDRLKFTLGQYATHIGYEVFDAPKNLNYSLSMGFAYGPYYHSGIKMDYQVSDKFGVMVGVVNGWDAIKDNNQAKSITAQVSYEPSENFWIYFNYMGGNEEPGDTVSSLKQVFDVSTCVKLTEKISLGFNGVIGIYNYESNPQQNWGGTAIYLKYAVTPYDAFGLRFEVFDDTQGVQNLGSVYSGVILTYIKKIREGNLIIKPEIRYDELGKAIYFNENSTLSTSQLTIGAAVIAYF